MKNPLINNRFTEPHRNLIINYIRSQREGNFYMISNRKKSFYCLFAKLFNQEPKENNYPAGEWMETSNLISAENQKAAARRKR